MKPIKVSAPGKLHLLGEHTVVYGMPALIAAVNKRCICSVTPYAVKNTIRIQIPKLGVSENISFVELANFQKHANKTWDEYLGTKNSAVLKEFTTPSNFMLCIISEIFVFYNMKHKESFQLDIASDIPIGSGMGSSASLAVSVAGAMSLFLNKPFDRQTINTIAQSAEKWVHVNPSGGDNSASCFGGFIWYRKETETLRLFEQLQVKAKQSLMNKFSIINTGMPDETTGEMIAKVRNFSKENKQIFQAILLDQEKLTRELLTTLQSQDEGSVKKIFYSGEKNLEALGVVSKSTKNLIQEIEKTGGSAKVCGAGGIKNASGVVLVFHENSSTVSSLAKRKNYEYYPIHLGESGVEIINE